MSSHDTDDSDDTVDSVDSVDSVDTVDTDDTDRTAATLVTGAAGRLGGAVTDHLIARGEAVVAVDRTAATTPGGAPVEAVELTDRTALGARLADCRAVIHCAAIPRPVGFDPAEVFTNNTAITFAVMQAALDAGLSGVVTCSSGSIYGSAYGEGVVDPVAPVDEDSALVYVDPYALSKHTDELTGAMFARRGLGVAALRFHWIATRDELAEATPNDEDTTDSALPLWGYVELDDAVRACRLARDAVARPDFGFHPILVVAADTVSQVPTEELLRRYQPTTRIARPIEGCGSAYDTRRARDLLGWTAEYSWRS